jgi:flagellar basal body-associated protein FliL
MHDHHEETQKSSKTLLKTMAVVFIVAFVVAALIR